MLLLVPYLEVSAGDPLQLLSLGPILSPASTGHVFHGTVFTTLGRKGCERPMLGEWRVRELKQLS